MQILQNFIREKYNLSVTEDIERQMIKIYKGARISRQRFSKIGNIVLTSPYQQNPASALGHVFLLQADSLPYPLWNTIEFVAETGDANKLSYITKGVYGGFAANYETIC